jgi:hypothetical protein
MAGVDVNQPKAKKSGSSSRSYATEHTPAFGWRRDRGGNRIFVIIVRDMSEKSAKIFSD